MADRLKLARDVYGAFESGDRGVYFERCWPNSGSIRAFEFKHLVESGDEVIVTYESTKTDGRRFRNTEVLTSAGERICRAEVYFGWDLD
jgi:hypothetical protein